MKNILATSTWGAAGISGSAVSYYLADATSLAKIVTSWVGAAVALAALINLIFDIIKKYRHRKD